MATEEGHGLASPSWFVAPGDTDSMAWVALAILFLTLYGVVTLYAAFDRWAEHQSKGTPLASTIPTLLTIALLYEIFPLGHFHMLLPLSAILIAMMVDWSRFNSRDKGTTETEIDILVASAAPEPPDDRGGVVESGSEEAKNV